MNGLLRKISSSVLDLLYPARCELCETPLQGNATLCSECAADLPRITAPHCDICGECYPGQIDGTFACPNCGDLSFAFEFARPVLRRDPRSLELIHRLKYGRRIDLVHSLGALLAEAFGDPRLDHPLAMRWPLVPVPLHRSRLRSRHFNQAEELAAVVAHSTGLPLVAALQRVRNTKTQTALGRSARTRNLKGAFQWASSLGKDPAVPQEGAILIDDVFTTGSTLNECAKTLRQAGCRTVVAITLMRG